MVDSATPRDGVYQSAPDYDVEIEADDLLRDLAERAARYGKQYEEHRDSWRRSWDWQIHFHEARCWMLEDAGGRRAYSEVIGAIQPGGRFRNDDGTVDVRGLMAWISTRSDEAHKDARGDYTGTRQADEAESAFAKILPVLRDDYGVGWPRFNDLGGVLERDLP